MDRDSSREELVFSLGSMTCYSVIKIQSETQTVGKVQKGQKKYNVFDFSCGRNV